MVLPFQVALFSGVSGALAAGAFSPADLFASGEDGGWYDPSDLTTLFQERTGASATTPASVGDSVGTILDKSGNGNHLIAAADIRRPVLQTDVGGRYYLDFDGVDDALSTASSIDLTGTDAIAFVVGVHKDVDTTLSIVAELSAAAFTTNGSFYVTAPRTTATGNYGSLMAGSISGQITTTAIYSAPRVDVLTLEGDISDDVHRLRISGTELSNFSDLGTGNFGNHKLFVGARDNSSLMLNGRIYGCLLIDRALTTAERGNLEVFLANKSGAVLA